MRKIVLALLLTALPISLLGQQDEIPPPAEDPSEAGRIVEDGPALQSFKRKAHPVSWLQSGMRPFLRLIEKAGFDKLVSEDDDTERIAGVKFGVKGLGQSSGFGPEVKPFHNDFLGTGIKVEAPFVMTYKHYQSAGFRANYSIIPAEDTDKLALEFTGGYTSRPSDTFFGIGNDTSHLDESRFRTVSRAAGLALNAQLTPHWSGRAETVVRSVGVTRPRHDVSALDAFREQNIPGLATGATLIGATVALQRDTKDHEHLPSNGGSQRFEVGLNEAQSGGDFSYWRYGVELEQYVPLGDDRKVLALRAELETNQEKGGSSVPLFDLPTIGGSSTVRGFQSRRFSDKSSISATVEYRYRIWRHFDWGLFVDAGQVAPEIGDFAPGEFHPGYGVRWIIRSQSRRGVILDLAHSRETWRFHVDFSPIF